MTSTKKHVRPEILKYFNKYVHAYNEEIKVGGFGELDQQDTRRNGRNADFYDLDSLYIGIPGEYEMRLYLPKKEVEKSQVFLRKVEEEDFEKNQIAANKDLLKLNQILQEVMEVY
tara:strand:+ start:857 stop:1201 length:345 start_codon:yes stop_codon:yes gene_type:complete